jgi:4-amino-4-deoxy-L-arabinose transferase-like glycosyltransferase
VSGARIRAFGRNEAARVSVLDHMPASPAPERRSRPGIPVVAAVVTFGLHLVGNPHYGFFRDELYFIVCGQHPQWGYVDQPPIAPLLAAATQLLGHSLFLLRAVPAAFAAGGVYVTCRLALELGGGAFAEIVAALTVFFAPVLMNFGMKVSPDMVGLWLWPLAALYTLRLTRGADPRGWLAVGAIVGVCLQSKYSVLFFAVSLLIALLLTRERRILFSRWFLAGGAVAGLIALPNFLWQAYYGFPMLELLRTGQHGKNLIVGPLVFLFQQLLITNVFLSVVWIVGLGWLLWNARLRFLGYTFVIVIALMILAHGKHYYPADAYPLVMAAGGVAIEGWTRRRRIVRGLIVGAIVAFGLLFLPFTMPVLPEEQMVAYADRVWGSLHVRREAVQTEHQRLGALSSDWADMHGWPELAATVARVYRSLPEADREEAVIATENYGEAAAIDFFGQEYGLPPVISAHNQYFLWGTHGATGNVVISVGGDCGAREHLFARVERAATFTDPWVQPYENDLPILVCRGIRKPLAEIWPKFKSYR